MRWLRQLVRRTLTSALTFTPKTPVGMTSARGTEVGGLRTNADRDLLLIALVMGSRHLGPPLVFIMKSQRVSFRFPAGTLAAASQKNYRDPESWPACQEAFFNAWSKWAIVLVGLTVRYFHAVAD